MKRHEIAVGAELFWAECRGWQSRPSFGRRVVVADNSCYRWPWYEGQATPPEIVKKSVGVLVDYYAPGMDEPTRRVVTLGRLRGPYQRVLAEVQRAEAARREQEEEYWADVRRRRAAQLNILDRAAALGFDVREVGFSIDLVAIPTEQLTQLLDLADRDQLRIGA